jgi:hypothetical protein
MIKFTFKLLIAALLLVSSSSFAGYIATDLTEDTYITYGGYDWTWAAPVNTTNFEGINPANNEWVTNVFEDPTVHDGWGFIEGSELELLFSELTIEHFKRVTDGTIIQSAAYWNSHFTHVDEVNFDDRSGLKEVDGHTFNYYETFYVRSAVAKVPEPTTLFIFAAGLFGFALRKRMTMHD